MEGVNNIWKDCLAKELPGRPPDAAGQFLRVVTANDIYSLDAYPPLASLVGQAKDSAHDLGCTVISIMAGDFLAPSVYTSLDGGITMATALSYGLIDYACFGNHEFDLGIHKLVKALTYFRGKVVNGNVHEEGLKDLPKYEVFDVGARKVLMSGFVTNSADVYVQDRLFKGCRVQDGCVDMWHQAVMGLGTLPDVYLVLTHQSVEDDINTAATLADQADLNGRCPVILGGHEHVPFVITDETHRTTIVKTGHDCENIGIVDIYWNATGHLKSSVTLIGYGDVKTTDHQAAQWVQEQHGRLEALKTIEITYLPNPMSSKNVRFTVEELCGVLLRLIKHGQRTHAVELAICQAGMFRGRADYSEGGFTLGHLYNEFATGNLQMIECIPGHVLAAAILDTRTRPRPTAAFLHVDDDCEINPEHVILQINGEVFDPGREYVTSINRNLLAGLDNVSAFVEWVLESDIRVPPMDSCPNARDVILGGLMRREVSDLRS